MKKTWFFFLGAYVFPLHLIFAQTLPLAPLGGHAQDIQITPELVYKRSYSLEKKFYEHQLKNWVYQEYLDLFVKYHGATQRADAKGKLAEYLILENALQGFSHPVVLDIKIGKATTSEEILALSGSSFFKNKKKQLQHWVTDRANKTHSYGYFLVKAYVDPKHQTKKIKKLLETNVHPLHSQKILREIFTFPHWPSSSKESLQECYREKLMRIRKFIEESATEESPIHYKFIGSSLLFTHDLESGRCSIKMIDFANTLVQRREDNEYQMRHRKKHTQGYIQGLENLIKFFK